MKINVKKNENVKQVCRVKLDIEGPIRPTEWLVYDYYFITNNSLSLYIYIALYLRLIVTRIIKIFIIDG